MNIKRVRFPEKRQQAQYTPKKGPNKVKAYSRGRGPYYIYFLKSGKYVKIGLSASIEKRITDLQTGNPVELELLCKYVVNSKYAESRLHQKFREDHTLNEWFYLSENIKNYIEEILKNERMKNEKEN